MGAAPNISIWPSNNKSPNVVSEQTHCHMELWRGRQGAGGRWREQGAGGGEKFVS